MNRDVIRFIFAAVATLTAAMPLMAETETVGNYTWTYRINGDTAEIYKNYGSAAFSPKPTGAVTIPAKWHGCQEKAEGNECQSRRNIGIGFGVR